MRRTGGHSNGHMTATGLVTGDTYQVIELREITTNLGSTSEGTTSSRFLIIGSGPNNKALVENLAHFTLTPTGKVTVDFFTITAKCVG
jgi:hypothetical protein